MNLKQFQERIKGKYEVSKMTVNTTYVMKLGSKGCVMLQYSDDKLKNIIVQGKEKEEIEKLLMG